MPLDQLQEFVRTLHLGIAGKHIAARIICVDTLFLLKICTWFLIWHAKPCVAVSSRPTGMCASCLEVLTVEEIEFSQRSGVSDMGSREGQRNRAIMETLYGCGLRESPELVECRSCRRYFDDGYVRVRGKGSKERISL